MFLIFDDHFVNLAKVDFIGGEMVQDEDDNNDAIWDLFIYQKGAVAIPLWRNIEGQEHAEAFRLAVLRHAGANGVTTGGDMVRLFEDSKPDYSGAGRCP